MKLMYYRPFLFLVLSLILILPISSSAQTQTLNITVAQDSYVNQNSPLTNYGSDVKFRSGWESSTTRVQPYIKFNISELYEHGTVVIHNATLYVYKKSDEFFDDYTHYLHDVYESETWTESNLTWENQPCGTGFNDTTRCNATRTSSYLATIDIERFWLFDASPILRRNINIGNRFVSVTINISAYTSKGVSGFSSLNANVSSQEAYLWVQYNWTENVTAPILSLPYNSDHLRAENTTFDWTDVAHVENYTLKILNATDNSTIDEIFGITDSDYTLNYTLTDYTYTWQVTARGLINDNQSDSFWFISDLINPDWTINTYPDFFNTSLVYNNSLVLDPSVFDVYLFEMNATVFAPNNSAVWGKFENNINTTSYFLNDSINVSGWIDGLYKIELTASDDHTLNSIPNYIVNKNEDRNQLEFITDTGTEINIRYNSDVGSGVALKSFGYEKLNDRYIFSFDMHNPSHNKKTYEFEVYSSEKIFDRSRFYEYPLFITSKHWIDFNLGIEGINYNVKVIDDYHVNIEIETEEDLLDFNSLGGLNIQTEIYEFTLNQNPPEITILQPENITYLTTTIPLTVSSNENIDTWIYNLNYGTNYSFTPNTTLSLSLGDYRIEVCGNETFYPHSWGCSSETFGVGYRTQMSISNYANVLANTNITIYANYEFLNGTSITNATCTVSGDITGTLTYNANNSRYENVYYASTWGIKHYTIQCSKSFYDTKQSSDTFTVISKHEKAIDCTSADTHYVSINPIADDKTRWICSMNTTELFFCVTRIWDADENFVKSGVGVIQTNPTRELIENVGFRTHFSSMGGLANVHFTDKNLFKNKKYVYEVECYTNANEYGLFTKNITVEYMSLGNVGSVSAYTTNNTGYIVGGFFMLMFLVIGWGLFKKII